MTKSRIIILCVAALCTTSLQIACAQSEHKSTPQEERLAPISPQHDIEQAGTSDKTHHYTDYTDVSPTRAPRPPPELPQISGRHREGGRYRDCLHHP